MSAENPVRQLNAEVARKIAAGEVIDRPNAIVRELMDNAIDSKASKITVEISGGGIEKVRIVDDGCGMTKEDLFACARPHATSKIQQETDLLKLTTLGFRGEALSSIAAVCRLSIISGGYKMKASITEDHIMEPAASLKGTIVQAEGLFENFPARRIFLKRPATESTMCKNTFIGKSLPNPQIAFRFVNDGEIKLDLPAGQTLVERFVKGMELKEPLQLFYEISNSSNNDFSFKIVLGEPGVFRPNKKDIYIFVNGRKINEYSLAQAVEYGGQGYFPNGTFPVAAVFINVDSSLVDFNIHPAKKEVRFKDLSVIHHEISCAVRNFYSEYTNRTMKKTTVLKSEQKDFSNDFFSPAELASKIIEESAQKEEKNYFQPSNTSYSHFLGANKNIYNSNNRNRFFAESKTFPIPQAQEIHEEKFLKTNDFNSFPEDIPLQTSESISSYMDSVIAKFNSKKQNFQKEQAFDFQKEKEPQIENTFNYIGTGLGTFIFAEKNSTLYIIDQHAAHERILFDQIMQERQKCQNLLIPYIIETKDKNEDKYLESIKENLKEIGFTCFQKEDGVWEFTTIHERWTGTQEELEHAIFDTKVEPEKIIYSIAAMTACKAAVKDGWKLDSSTAAKIAKEALSLQDPHCPHGRPVFTTITREKLFSLVKRT